MSDRSGAARTTINARKESGSVLSYNGLGLDDDQPSNSVSEENRPSHISALHIPIPHTEPRPFNSMPKGARNSDQMYGISPLATKWLVILTRKKVVLQKTFSHSTYGGSSGALAAAQAWRDEMIRRHPPALKRDEALKIRSSNTSGITGVRCRLGPDGKPQLWMVQIKIGSFSARKSFSVGRYGEQAKLLALAEREKHLALLEESRISHHPADQVAPDTPPVPAERWQTRPNAKCEIMKASNTSGMAGVFCRYVKGEPRGWVAKTHVAGRVQRTEFSVPQHGEEVARTMAIAERKLQLERAAEFRSSASTARRKQGRVR